MKSSRAQRDEISFGMANPDRVFAAAPRLAVEPAVDRVDDEPFFAQQLAPLGHGQPGEREPCLRALAADAQRQRLSLLVPVGALEDARLALEPAAVRLDRKS